MRTDTISLFVLCALFLLLSLWIFKKAYTFALAFLVNVYDDQLEGTLAQLVEHRTENPGVPGSIPGGTTEKAGPRCGSCFFNVQIPSTKFQWSLRDVRCFH